MNPCAGDVIMNPLQHKHHLVFWICIFVVLSFSTAYPQVNIPIGTWRNHFAYNRAVMVENADRQIYCITESGMFIYFPGDHSVQLLSKIDGLSEVAISAVQNISGEEMTVIGYENGNIDLVENKEISNLAGIREADIPYEKRILDISYSGKRIYFITGFGVVVYDRDQHAFRETWQNLSESGGYLGILMGTILRDTIFLATEKGVIAGDLRDDNNLMDYRNWKRFDAENGLPQAHTRLIESFDQDLYVVQEGNLVSRYKNGYWDRALEQIEDSIVSLRSSPASLVITSSDGLHILDRDLTIHEVDDENFLSLHDAIIVNDEIFAADYINGLIHLGTGSSEVIRPSGPFSNDVFKMYDFDDKMIALPDGFDDQLNPLRNKDGFYYFSDGTWTNYNNSGGQGYNPLPDLTDLVDIAFNTEQGKVYFASFGYGLLEWDGSETFTVYDENTPGVTLVNSNPPEPYTLVPGIDLDNTGKLWIANYSSNLPLHSFDGKGNWEAFNIAATGALSITDLIVTVDHNKWMIVNPASGGGIIVFNTETGQLRRLTSQPGSGSLPDNHVTAIIEDLEGQVWIGTTNGVAYFPFPFLVFDEPDFEVIRPIYENNYLFDNESITAVEVDGGNRKWIGTAKGAWLFSSDGTDLVVNYNPDNSPLPSGLILDIEVNQHSGEVFFGTEKGIVSYRSDATLSHGGHAGVKIFPNPVTPTFSGIVGIEGLPQQALVKITDIAGNLVYETQSEGGMATWNVLDKNGRRPDTGIYLVFSSTEDGGEAYVGKLAIIN